VDFIALNTINATEPTKATNNANMLKQPTGTNQFQFRFHQLGLGARGTGGGFCSTESFYFSREAFCNENTLTFTLVSDTCRDRKKNVLLAWHQNSRQPLRQPSPNCPSVSAQTRSFNCVLPAVRAQ
jgi:hypothetical protein